jgi:hypothetical protein
MKRHVVDRRVISLMKKTHSHAYTVGVGCGRRTSAGGVAVINDADLRKPAATLYLLYLLGWLCALL